MADFINEGHLDRHIRRMRMLYEGRRKTLIDAFSKYIPNRVSVLGDDAGMHLTARLRTHFDENDLINRAAKQGVEIVSTSSNYLQPHRRDEFIFGYSNLSERQIERGIRNLSQALK